MAWFGMMLAGAAALLIGFYGLPWAWRRAVARRQTARVHAAGCACLTFDDGPDPETTPHLLELLDRAGVRATFFLLGRHVERWPELARMIAERGHEIGEHGYDHVHAWKTAPWRYLADLRRSRRTLAPFRRPGRPALFRPAHGKMNLLTLAYLAATGTRPVFWSVDPKDYEPWWDVPTVAERIRRGLVEGGIILLHDGRLRREGLSPAHQTLQALEQALDGAGPRSIRPVGELLWPPPDPTRRASAP